MRALMLLARTKNFDCFACNDGGRSILSMKACWNSLYVARAQYFRALYDLETKALGKVRKMMANLCQRKRDGKMFLHACTDVLARIKDLKSGAKH